MFLQAYPRYAFEYAVKDPHTGDNKAQWEKRDGDVVKGNMEYPEPLHVNVSHRTFDVCMRKAGSAASYVALAPPKREL